MNYLKIQMALCLLTIMITTTLIATNETLPIVIPINAPFDNFFAFLDIIILVGFSYLNQLIFYLMI